MGLSFKLNALLKLLAITAIVGMLAGVMVSSAFAIGPPDGTDVPADEVASPTGHDSSCEGQDPHKNPAFGDHSAPGRANFVMLHDAWHAECDPDLNHIVD